MNKNKFVSNELKPPGDPAYKSKYTGLTNKEFFAKVREYNESHPTPLDDLGVKIVSMPEAVANAYFELLKAAEEEPASTARLVNATRYVHITEDDAIEQIDSFRKSK